MFSVDEVKFRVLRDAGPNYRIMAAFVDARQVAAVIREQFDWFQVKHGDPIVTRTEKRIHVAVPCTISSPVVGSDTGLYERRVSDVGEHEEALADKYGNLSDKTFKSAYSDAFKRAAVHLGIGTELYDYDAVMGKPLMVKTSLLKDGKFMTDEADAECRKLWGAYLKKMGAGGAHTTTAPEPASSVAEPDPPAPTAPTPQVSIDELKALRDQYQLDEQAKQQVWALVQTGATHTEVAVLAKSLGGGVGAVQDAFDAEEVPA